MELDFVVPSKRVGREVPDYPGVNPRIVLIGEAPGKREDELGQPFVGPSEVRLRDFWRGTGIRRSDCYITNLHRKRPPANEIAAISTETLLRDAEELQARVRAVPANVIVPTGNYALWGLFGGGFRERKISDYRGSILSWEGRKVIPVIHPAATFRQPILGEFCTADWKRIAEESLSPALDLPQRTHIIDPDEEEMDRWIEALYAWSDSYQGDTPPVVAVDVENTRDRPRNVTCVGFSFDPGVSLTIPLAEPTATAPLPKRIAAIREICSSPTAKVLQNGLTDQIKLDANGIELRHYDWDLIEMAHALNPNDGGDTLSDDEVELGQNLIRIPMKSLAVLTSLYTRQPFYKFMSDSPRWEDRQIYNGLDACVTREIFPVLWGKLRDKGLL